MGVPKFFRWLSERYPLILERCGSPPTVETYQLHFGSSNSNNTSSDDENYDDDSDDKKKKNDNNKQEQEQPPDYLAKPDPLSTCRRHVHRIDRLYIDMNGIIHGCAHNNIPQTNHSNINSSSAPPLGNDVNDNDDDDVMDDGEMIRIDISSPVSEDEIFRNTCYYLDRIIRDVAKPRELVYIAIDGVAPRAKLNQQRARRYRASKEGEIERTVYDAHMQALQQQQQQQQEQEDRKYQDSDNDDDGDEYILSENEVLYKSYRSTTSKTNSTKINKPSNKQSMTGSLHEVEPGRFAGKFEMSGDDDSTTTTTTKEERLDDDTTDNNQDDNTTPPALLFHSNSITPGTSFFQNCTRHLEHFIQYKLCTDPAWQHLTIIFSGPNDPGEGEHKIMQFIREQKAANLLSNNNNNSSSSSRYNPNLRHCIMGQDGDLIMLALATHEPNMMILREKVLFDDERQHQRALQQSHGLNVYLHNARFEFLHLNVLRDYLALEFETLMNHHLDDNNNSNYPFDMEATIDDVVFLTFLIGNDFLPHLPALDIADGALDLLFYLYRDQRQKWIQQQDVSSSSSSASSSSSKEEEEKKTTFLLPPYLTHAGTIVSARRLEEFFQAVGAHESQYYNYKKATTNVERDRETQAKYGGPELIPTPQVMALKEEADRIKYREMLLALEHSQNDDNNNKNDLSRPSSSLPASNKMTNGFTPVMSTMPWGMKKQTLSSNRIDDSDDEAAERQNLFSSVGSFLKNSVSTVAHGSGGGINGTIDKKKKLSNEGMELSALVDDEDLKGRYYADKFGFSPYDQDKHLALRKSYIEGLVWNLQYYYHKTVSWEWYYPYHYGPMMSDLVGLEAILNDISFGDEEKENSIPVGKPLDPFVQLMACMPSSKASVLPKPYRWLMTDPSSPIRDYYPSSFTVDMNGKRWPWEAVVLLPFMDAKRLVDAAATVDKSELTSEEQERNVFKEATVYYNDPGHTRRKLESFRNDATRDHFDALDECTTAAVPFPKSPWAYRPSSSLQGDEESPRFTPKLHPDVEYPLEGLPTLRDGSIQSMWRRKIRVNVHGNPSRYSTALLVVDQIIPEVLPIQQLADHLIGTTVFINYPHFIESFVTAVSDSRVVIRGGDNEKPRHWTPQEATRRKQRLKSIVLSYKRGLSLPGTGGLVLAGGNAGEDLDVLLCVRPLTGLTTLPDGTVAKTFAKYEVEVPLFVTAWKPFKYDSQEATLPAALEKDPYHAAKRILLNPGTGRFVDTHEIYRSVPPRKAKAIIPKANGMKGSSSTIDLTPGAMLGSRLFSSGPHVGTVSDSSSLLPCIFMRNQRKFTTATRCVSAFNSKVATEKLVPALGRFHLGEKSAYYQSHTYSKSSSLQRPMRRTVARVPSPGRLIVAGVLAAVSFFSIRGAAATSHHASLEQGLSMPVARHTPPLEFAHGTTTLSFVFQGGIVAAVDSRASMGSFVSSKTTQKVLPINSVMLGTMAGGAADCQHWIRKLSMHAAMFELNNDGRRMSVARASRLLSNWLYENRALGLSVGTMIMGFDDDENSPPRIYYLDNSGMRIEGDIFACGSGSTFALGILDTERRYDMTTDEAVALGIKAIRHATFRDAHSGGFINVYLITRHGWKRVFRQDLAAVSMISKSTTPARIE